MLSQIIVGVAIAVLVALFNAVIAEVVTPALREWRERRKAASQVPAPAKKARRDWRVWVPCAVAGATWLAWLAYSLWMEACR